MEINARVGETAGRIWHLLNDEGPQKFPQLKKNLHGSGELLSFALGWLAREDKVDITLNSHSSRLLASEKHVSDTSPALAPRVPSPQWSLCGN